MTKTRSLRTLASALVAAGALTVGALGAASTAQAGSYYTGPSEYSDPTMDLERGKAPLAGYGPYWSYVQQIMINTVVPMKNKSIINLAAGDKGFLYRSGQQNNNTTITYVGGKLRFEDPATASWLWLPPSCDNVPVATGIAAVCDVPTGLANPMLIEVWPRLGNDRLDTSTLPAQFDVSFLGDRGNDTFFGGDGDDFFNGAQDVDRADGGDGNDWLRTGEQNDVINGGLGNDYLVGVHQDDVVNGNGGDDRVYGAGGNDQVSGGAGVDRIVCGDGRDEATVDGAEKPVLCEVVTRAS